MIAVAVLPLPPEKEFKPLPEAELDIKFQRGTGSGGQHKNVTDSACKMKHKPTGLDVYIDGRDQHANRREALKILTAKVNQLRNGQLEANYNSLRKEHLAKSGRGSKIRTYNFVKNRAVDHRTNKKTNKIRDVIEKGHFDLLI